jgi:hypothetical protein
VRRSTTAHRRRPAERGTLPPSKRPP